MKHAIQDIRDAASAAEHAISEWRPEFIFHLAAQALVRVSYREPVHDLRHQRARHGPSAGSGARGESSLHRSSWSRPTSATRTTAQAAHSFKETDPLGGHDPYSASKAAAEIVVASYRDSFFAHGDRCRARLGARGQRHRRRRLGRGPHRARLRPRALGGQAGPGAQSGFTRPWQHVLEPLGGYLLLGAKLEQARQKKSAEEIARYAQAFNFGPNPGANRSVRDLYPVFYILLLYI